MLDQVGEAIASSALPASRNPNESDVGIATAALLDRIGPVQGSRVLLIGCGCAVELMGGLIRCGCADATLLRPDGRPTRESADVAVVCHAPATARIDEEIANARRALAPLGGLVVRLPLDSSAWLVRHAIRLLRLHGFCSLCGEQLPDAIALTAELPAFGRLARTAA